MQISTQYMQTQQLLLHGNKNYFIVFKSGITKCVHGSNQHQMMHFNRHGLAHNQQYFCRKHLIVFYASTFILSYFAANIFLVYCEPLVGTQIMEDKLKMAS